MKGKVTEYANIQLAIRSGLAEGHSFNTQEIKLRRNRDGPTRRKY